MSFSPSEANAKALATTIESILENPDTLAWFQNSETRRRLREAGRKLSVAMEAPGDSIHRVINTPLQLSLARVGVEKGIFQVLSQGQTSTFTNADLAQKTSIDPTLMKRLLRYYQAHDMISQPSDDGYAPNNVTLALSSNGGQSGVNYFAEMISPSFMALPEFLRTNGYRNVTDPANCPWHLGHKTDLSPFPWLMAHPDHMGYFLPWMAANREGLPVFFDAVNFQEEFAKTADSSTPVFVDVGGAMGHQCIALRQRYPELTGRVILQDQEQVISQAKASPLPGFTNIETQSHDFFKPQPVKGALAYYLRNVLHDWPDHKCREILQNLKTAMSRDSVILIDEMVLPERGAPWRATQLDMSMLTCLAAMERTEAEWRGLLAGTGLQVKKIWKYSEECEDSIIVAVLE